MGTTVDATRINVLSQSTSNDEASSGGFSPGLSCGIFENRLGPSSTRQSNDRCTAVTKRRRSTWARKRLGDCTAKWADSQVESGTSWLGAKRNQRRIVQVGRASIQGLLNDVTISGGLGLVQYLQRGPVSGGSTHRVVILGAGFGGLLRPRCWRISRLW